MDKKRYTELGIFESKQKAMIFRNEKYRWCSCFTETEKSKTKLWVKLPK